jgi:predicted cupin superfamily sugar epimerase
MNHKDIIEELQLQPHPEGGFYAETYRSSAFTLNQNGEKRNLSTAIYFLLHDTNKSNFHRIQSDELWFFHQGEPIEIVTIQDGKARSIILGNAIEKGELPQATIPANTWFGSKLKDGKGFALVSCTVAPGFDFLDFELAEREKLVTEFPNLRALIEEFTP